MPLRDWLYKNRVSIKNFCAVIGVDRSYVHQWLRGDYIPSDTVMTKIRAFTADQVFTKEELKDEQKISRKTGQRP